MALTLLQLIQRVSRKVGLDPTITSFSDTDETNDLVQDIAEAYEDLLAELPPQLPYLHGTGSITTVAGTRLYALAANARAFDLNEWSFQNETDDDSPLELVTREFIQKLDPKYDETQNKPLYLYLEGSDQLGVYPVPDDVYTISYSYGAGSVTRVSATTDTFIIPDRWLRYVEKSAQASYERRKGFSGAEETAVEAFNLFADVMVEAWELVPTYMVSEGFDTWQGGV